jgi:glutamyl-tRNA synthetase
MNPVVRFAPSPTGQLHIGGVRTALFNYLFARKNSGTFLLRIEDTDQERSKEKYTKQILDSLRWLGFNYDSDPVTQSSRSKRYHEVISMLIESGSAYHCFATEKELKDLREKEGTFLYPGTWRDRSSDEINERLNNNEKYTVRLKVPLEGDIRFTDLIYGNIDTNSTELDDFIIARSDGSPTYNLTVVVDDHDMQVSHVIRGEDHISNTPKQILIYDALNWDIPEFAHLPMILGSDGSRLSKRHGAAGTQAYQELGYLPETLINYLSLLGWNPGTEDEIFNLEYLIENFSLEKVNKKAAVFDSKKLDWMSAQHITNKDPSQLLDLIKILKPEWGNSGSSDEHLRSVISSLKGRSKTLLDIINHSQYFFSDPSEYDQDAVSKCWKEETSNILNAYAQETLVSIEWDENSIDRSINEFADTKEIGKGKLIQPLRLALSGTLTGPSVVQVMMVLGKDTCLRRIKNILNSIQK